MSQKPSAFSRQHTATIIAGALAAVLFVPATVSAAEPPAKKKIMLGAIAAPSIPAEQTRSLESLVCAELAQNRVYDVVCPDDVGAVLKEQQLKMGLGACMDGDCMNAAGRLMESDYTVAGSVDLKDGRYLFSLTIVEGTGGMAVAKAAVETAADVEKMTPKIKALVADLYRNLATPPPRGGVKAATDRPEAQPAAPAPDDKKRQPKNGNK